MEQADLADLHVAIKSAVTTIKDKYRDIDAALAVVLKGRGFCRSVRTDFDNASKVLTVKLARVKTKEAVKRNHAASRAHTNFVRRTLARAVLLGFKQLGVKLYQIESEALVSKFLPARGQAVETPFPADTAAALQFKALHCNCAPKQAPLGGANEAESSDSDESEPGEAHGEADEASEAQSESEGPDDEAESSDSDDSEPGEGPDDDDDDEADSGDSEPGEGPDDDDEADEADEAQSEDDETDEASEDDEADEAETTQTGATRAGENGRPRRDRKTVTAKEEATAHQNPRKRKRTANNTGFKDDNDTDVVFLRTVKAEALKDDDEMRQKATRVFKFLKTALKTNKALFARYKAFMATNK